MLTKKTLYNILSCTNILLGVFLIMPKSVIAQSPPVNAPAMTSCVVTIDSGGPGPEGLNTPSNLSCKSDGYCKLPTSPSGGYRSYACANRSYGSKELIAVINTVAERWKQKYPNGFIHVGDLNAGLPHHSHYMGRAVDLQGTTNGKDRIMDRFNANYNREATIEAGKMFLDTNLVENLWYRDQAVNAALLKYANDTGRSKGINIQPIAGHDNHFHIDIKLNPKLPKWEPNC